MTHSDGATVAARLTAPGRGAIATIWLRGPNAIPAVDRWFRGRGGHKVSSASAGRILYGTWAHPQGDEDVIVVPIDSQTIEVSSHGGAIAAELILRALEHSGVTRIDETEAMVRQCGCPWQAAAAVAATQAFTLRAADRLLGNADGRWTKVIAEICDLLRGDRQGWPAVLAALKWLRKSFDVGCRMVRGWEIAIAGRPNVGKSSLINRLLGYDRSIVYDRPGTTRDLIRERSAVAGWPVALVDMAGLRDSDSDIERIGVEWARRAMEVADAVIWISDISQPWTSDDQQVFDRLPRAIHLINKSDLPPAEGPRPIGLTVSLLKDPTIDGILHELEQRLFADLPDASTPLLVAPWQCRAIDEAIELLTDGLADDACRRLQRAGYPEPNEDSRARSTRV